MAYLKQERGLQGIYAYLGVTNGFASGYGPLLIAFFRTAPGLTAAMYSFFSVAEFIGRAIGGLFCYKYKMPPKKKFGFAFFVYQFYDLMDMILLWLPYPLMLVNRGCCGLLGVTSATLRQAAVQRYIPDAMRSRLNALENIVILGCSGVLGLAVGALGELLDLRVCMSLCSCIAVCAAWLTIWRNRSHIHKIYESQENV